MNTAEIIAAIAVAIGGKEAIHYAAKRVLRFVDDRAKAREALRREELHLEAQQDEHEHTEKVHTVETLRAVIEAQAKRIAELEKRIADLEAVLRRRDEDVTRRTIAVLEDRGFRPKLVPPLKRSRRDDMEPKE